MKQLLIAILSMISILSSSMGQVSWINFKGEKPINFTVDAPEDMKLKTSTIETSLGKLDSYTYVLQQEDNAPNYLYLINIIAYPEGTFHPDSTDLKTTFMDESILSITQSVGGTLSYSSDIKSLSNGDGRVFRIKLEGDNALMKCRTFLKDDYLVVLQVFALIDNALNEEMNTFLESFKLQNGIKQK